MEMMTPQVQQVYYYGAKVATKFFTFQINSSLCRVRLFIVFAPVPMHMKDIIVDKFSSRLDKLSKTNDGLCLIKTIAPAKHFTA